MKAAKRPSAKAIKITSTEPTEVPAAKTRESSAMKSATVEAAATKASAMETASALSEAELWRRDERNSNESYYKSSEKSGRIHFATS
jgi:hypothetical protein